MKPIRVVRRLIAEFGTHDPFVICKNLGIHILRHPLGSVRGYFAVVDGLPTIILNDTLTDAVLRFVCAHELGHYALHRSLNRVFMDYHTYMLPSKYENEADMFAVHMLWGEPPMYQEDCLTDWKMADCLNIAACNINARLLELGLYW